MIQAVSTIRRSRSWIWWVDVLCSRFVQVDNKEVDADLKWTSDMYFHVQITSLFRRTYILE